MLIGLGVVTLTQEKIEKVVNDFVKKNKISKTEGKRLVKKMLKDSKGTEKNLVKNLNKGINNMLKGEGFSVTVKFGKGGTTKKKTKKRTKKKRRKK
jgi:polyhydroxyalkanoate synthesis regulator phasin